MENAKITTDEAMVEFLTECEVRQYTSRTIKGYRNGLEFFINFLNEKHGVKYIDKVTTRQIKDFFVWQRHRGRKETYLNGLLKTFRSFFKYMEEEKYVPENPVLKIHWMKEQMPVIKTFSDNEVKRMIDICGDSNFLEIRNKAMIAMMCDTGIRCLELCMLQIQDITDTVITIHGKGKKDRQVGISPALRKILIKYERARRMYVECRGVDNVQNYFISRRYKQLTDTAVEWVVKTAADAANIDKSIRRSPHTCRHYFAQAQLRNGIDVYSLSRLMGHNTVAITQRYLQSMKDKDIVVRSVTTSPLMHL